MKAISLVLAFSGLFTVSGFGQKEKTEKYNFRYERFPSIDINSAYKTSYPKMIELPASGIHTDSIDVSTPSKFQTSYMYLPATIPSSVRFPNLKKTEEQNADIITVLFYKVPLVSSKEISVNKSFVPAPGGDLIDGGFNYKMKISIECKLIVKDKNGTIIMVDSVGSENTEECYFPNDNYFTFKHPGLNSQKSLEESWVKYRDNFLRYTEINVLSHQVEKLNEKLKDYFTSDNSEVGHVRYYYLKDKKNTYSDLDTCLQLFTSIFDSVSANQKVLNHKNWHTKTIKEEAGKCYAILNKASAEAVKTLKENKDSRFEQAFIEFLLIDLCTAQWLKGDFKGALEGLELMKKKWL